jgi:hypothetical protein
LAHFSQSEELRNASLSHTDTAFEQRPCWFTFCNWVSLT